jgi:hypothetical protein
MKPDPERIPFIPLDPSTQPPNKDKFARSLIDALRQAGESAQLQYQPEAFRLQLLDDKGAVVGLLNLENAFHEYAEADLDQQPRVLQRIVRGCTSRFKTFPVEFDDARPDLLPILRRRAYFEWSSLRFEDRSRTLFQPVSEHFALALAYDLPEVMQLLPAAQLREWNVSFDEALTVALTNLRERSREPFEAVAPGTWRSPWRDNYDASRLVLPDLIRGLPVQGEPIVIVPHRDVLLVTGSEDEAGLGRLLDLAEPALQETRAVSGSQARDYFDQQEVLAQQSEDVFVASFLFQKRGRARSVSVWTAGVDTLLPRTDLVVCLPAEPGKENPGILASASWERVCEVVGHRMERTELYPERYRVRTFPDAKELAALGRADQCLIGP